MLASELLRIPTIGDDAWYLPMVDDPGGHPSISSPTRPGRKVSWFARPATDPPLPQNDSGARTICQIDFPIDIIRARLAEIVRDADLADWWQFMAFAIIFRICSGWTKESPDDARADRSHFSR